MHRPTFASETRTYGLILLALLFLTAVTVWIAGFHFQSEIFNVTMALGIATAKASLVALFFMHLRHDKPMNGLIFLTGLTFLAVFLLLILADTETRLPVKPSGAAAQVVRNPA